MAQNNIQLSENDQSSQKDILVEASNILKVYGATKAVENVSLSLHTGEALGLVGANGAGKSTLMRIIAGVTRPNSGSLKFFNSDVDLEHYTPAQARQLGIRVVYQELSLCTNLKVYENFYIEQHQRFAGRGWRKNALEAVRTALDDVFPGNNINPSEVVENLTIAQRQMVEIARASSDPDLKLLILDEPTSSLGAEQTKQLIEYVLKTKKNGISFIFISHRLNEVLQICDQIAVMNNGCLKCNVKASTVDEEFLVSEMSGSMSVEKRECGKETDGKCKKENRKVLININNMNSDELHDISINMFEGEIVGLAGLEGSGQKDILHVLYKASSSMLKSGNISVNDTVAYVSGDRTKEGVFPLWSIIKNMTITKLTKFRDSVLIDKNKEVQLGNEWYENLKIKSTDMNDLLLSLSGGNQQKVLIARALLSNARIILLDDPSRGVDVETKRQLLQLYKEVAAQGKLVIWYSTEDEELTGCDRVLVMRDGYIVRELVQDEISKDRIIESSFITVKAEGGNNKKNNAKESFGAKAISFFNTQRAAMPLIAMIIIFAAIGINQPNALSGFGLNLLIGSAVPLVLAAISQMFIIAASDIDLGLGAYLGFTNVISATLLVSNPVLGILVLAAGILGYGLLAALIHKRKLPSIVVSVGASFIWLGIAISIMEKPGGSSPEWLMKFFNFSFPVIPFPMIISLVIAAAAYLVIIRSSYGTVLRGFGNNPKSVERSGWSILKARVSLYLLAGLFGALGGMSLTGITTAADANSASSYTLLTIAAVVMGGGELTGGIVDPIGVVIGAITLSMVGALIGFLDIGNSFQPAVQGGLLFLILAIRTAMRRKHNEH
ncbi:MAG TPA: ATP-binding cassette domain-containing protein [Clostridia bacterium]|nr:ATP-binding cassette domain-containing protein [Clostridia bacterium]